MARGRKDDLKVLNGPGRPSRPSTWRALLLIIRRLYGFGPGPCRDHDRVFYLA
jgi:hypothetical protein